MWWYRNSYHNKTISLDESGFDSPESACADTNKTASDPAQCITLIGCHTEGMIVGINTNPHYNYDKEPWLFVYWDDGKE